MRVAAIDYEPSFRMFSNAPLFLGLSCTIDIKYLDTGDILKARIQTVGVEEHEVVVEPGDHPFPGEIGSTWLFYDVGGSRHQRAAWAPFFDDGELFI